MDYDIRVGYLEMFDIETEENLQCGFTTTGGAKSSSGGAVSDRKVNEPKKPQSPEDGTHDVLPKNAASAVKKIQNITGMSEKDAIESARAINSFTKFAYDDIRNLEYAGKTSPEVKAINRYLDKMPKFQGEVSRGKQFDSPEEAQIFINKMKQGAPYVLPAMSSFSSDRGTAQKFANIEKSAGVEKSTPMVLVVAANKRGVSIRSLSDVRNEDEVLVPKKTKYKLKGEPYQKNGTWFVPLGED